MATPFLIASLFLALFTGNSTSQQKPAAGNPAAGKQVFATANPACTLCHKVGKSGGVLGPDLSAIGTKRNAAWLMKYLPNPQASDPKNKMPPVKVTGQDLTDLVAYLVSLKGK